MLFKITMPSLNPLKWFQSEPVAAPPMGEVAVNESQAATSLSNAIDTFNPDPLTRAKGGLQVYDSMRDDDVVKASLMLKKLAVISPGWDIEPADQDDTESVKQADYIETVLNKMVGSVDDVLFNILTGVDYGFSVNEIVWNKLESGDFAGKIGIKTIKSKRPHYYDFKVDAFSNLMPDGLVLTGLLTPQENLPVNKFLLYSYQKEFGNWYGKSDLNAAYASWWKKSYIQKMWAIYLERHAQPLIWGKHKTSNKTLIDGFKRALKNIQSKTSFTSTIGDFEIELLESKKTSDSDFKPSLDFFNRAIARAILIPDEVSDSSSGEGSNARARVRFDIFMLIVEKLRRDIEEIVMTEQLIRRLIGFSFGEVDELPKFKFRPLTQEQRLDISEAFGNLVQKGAISPTLEDENMIRKNLKFPEKVSLEEGAGSSPPSPAPSSPSEKEEAAGQGEKKEMAARDKTRFENGINFQDISKTLDMDEAKTVESLQGWLTKQRDDLIKFVSNKMSKNQLNTRMVFDLDLRFKPNMKKDVNSMFEKVYNQGIVDGKTEIPKQFATTGKQGIEVKPDKALSFLKNKTDFVVKGINDPLLGDIQRVLVNAIDIGQSVPNTVKAIEDAYIPYLSDETVISKGKLLEPFRLEAIVRTNMSQAYNQGRRAIGEDPDVKDFVLGYQFSEIIDSRTVAVSKFADKKTIRVNDPRLPELTYPLHWQDRGLFVYITSDMQPVAWTSDADLDSLLSMVRETKP